MRMTLVFGGRCSPSLPVLCSLISKLCCLPVTAVQVTMPDNSDGHTDFLRPSSAMYGDDVSGTPAMQVVCRKHMSPLFAAESSSVMIRDKGAQRMYFCAEQGLMCSEGGTARLLQTTPYGFWSFASRLTHTCFWRTNPCQCDLLSPLLGLTSDLWLLWELMLTVQPLVIISTSPARCVGQFQRVVSGHMQVYSAYPPTGICRSTWRVLA